MDNKITKSKMKWNGCTICTNYIKGGYCKCDTCPCEEDFKSMSMDDINNNILEKGKVED